MEKSSQNRKGKKKVPKSSNIAEEKFYSNELKHCKSNYFPDVKNFPMEWEKKKKKCWKTY